MATALPDRDCARSIGSEGSAKVVDLRTLYARLGCSALLENCCKQPLKQTIMSSMQPHALTTECELLAVSDRPM